MLAAGPGKIGVIKKYRLKLRNSFICTKLCRKYNGKNKKRRFLHPGDGFFRMAGKYDMFI